MMENKQNLKETLGRWHDAVEAYNQGRYTDAVGIWNQIPELSARMLYNMGCAHLKLKQPETALKVSKI